MTRDDVIRQARTISAGLAAGPVLCAVAVALAHRGSDRFSWLVVPALIAGIVAPVIAWRVALAMRSAGPKDEAARLARFTPSLTLVLGLTELAAFFGVVTLFLSADPTSLVGVLTHVVTVFALWPTRERVDKFVAAGAGR